MLQGQLQGVQADIGEVLDKNQLLDEVVLDVYHRLHKAAGQVWRANMPACLPSA